MNLANALLEHERITTTEAKAKDLRRYVERLITLGKRAGTEKGKQLAARRVVHSRLRDPYSVDRLFGPLAERYKERHGGYTRIMKLGRRHGDNAAMAIIELVDREEKAAAEPEEETAAEE